MAGLATQLHIPPLSRHVGALARPEEALAAPAAARGRLPAPLVERSTAARAGATDGTAAGDRAMRLAPDAWATRALRSGEIDPAVAAVAWADEGQEPRLDVLAAVTAGEDDGPELGGAIHGSSVTVWPNTA